MPQSVPLAKQAYHRRRVSEYVEYVHQEKENGYFD
jgi:hypothetical protein